MHIKNLVSKNKIIHIILIASICMLMASCQGTATQESQTETEDSVTQPTTASSSQTEATPPPTTSEETETETTSETTESETIGVTELDQMGYITSVSTTGTPTIHIDYVEMYFGDDALEKAIDDESDRVEYIDGEPFIANDYYIRNNNPLIREFPLASECEIYMIPDMGGPEATHLATATELKDAVDLFKRLVVIDVIEGEVVRIEEMYVP